MTIRRDKITENEKEFIIRYFFSGIFWSSQYCDYDSILEGFLNENELSFDTNLDTLPLSLLSDFYIKLNRSLPSEVCYLINDSGEKITQPIFESIQRCSVQFELYLAKTFWFETEIIDSNGLLLTKLHSNETFGYNSDNYDGGDWVDNTIQVGENEDGFLIKHNQYSFASKYGCEEQTYQIKQYNPSVSTNRNDTNQSSFQVTRELKDMPDFTLNDVTFPDFLSNQMEIDFITKIRKNPFLFKDQVIAILTKENIAFENCFVRSGYYEIKNWYLVNGERFSGGLSNYTLDNLSIYPYLPFKLKVDLDVLLALFIRCMYTTDLEKKGIVPPLNLQELKNRIDQSDSQVYESRNYFPIILDESFTEEQLIGSYTSEIVPFINNNLSRKRELFFLFPEIIYFAPDSVRENDEIALEAVHQNGMALRHLSENFKNNKQIVLTAVKQNGLSIKYASNLLKNNKQIVLSAVRQNALSIEYASDFLKNNREIVISAIKQSAIALKYASNNYKNDRKIARMAVNQNPNLLADLPAEMKNDKMVVLTAVKQDGLALKYASNELKNDRKVVLTAIKQNGLALAYASDSFKSDREFVSSVVRKNGLALEFASDSLKNDKQLVMTAIKQSGCALEYASSELKHDKSIALAAIKNDWRSFEFVPKELRSDQEIIKAYSKTGRLSNYISNIIRNNSYAVFLFVKKQAMNLEFASDELKDNKKIVMEAIKQNGTTLYFASDSLKNNPQVVLKAVKQNGMALQYASEKMRNNKKIVLAAIQNAHESFEFASDNLKEDFDVLNELMF